MERISVFKKLLFWRHQVNSADEATRRLCSKLKWNVKRLFTNNGQFDDSISQSTSIGNLSTLTIKFSVSAGVKATQLKEQSQQKSLTTLRTARESARLHALFAHAHKAEKSYGWSTETYPVALSMTSQAPRPYLRNVTSRFVTPRTAIAKLNRGQKEKKSLARAILKHEIFQSCCYYWEGVFLNLFQPNNSK